MKDAVIETCVNPPAQPAEIARVLILGHSGFIGSHLEKFFQRHFPGIEVVGRSAPEFDLTREQDAETLAGFLNLQTVVVMCAAIKRQLGDSLDTFSQNVQMVVNLCRQLQQRPVKRLVFFSSAAVYGEEVQNTCITEQTPVHPTSFYGTAKYAAERLLEKVIPTNEQSSLLILRPPLIYGPGDQGSIYGPSGFARAAINGETISIWGDGTERREFMFVEDIAEIVCRLVFNRYKGVLNVASGRSYTYLDILEVLSRTLPGKIQTTSRPRSKNKVDHGFSNTTLAKLLPGFSFTPLQEGIRRTIIAQQGR